MGEPIELGEAEILRSLALARAVKRAIEEDEDTLAPFGADSRGVLEGGQLKSVRADIEMLCLAFIAMAEHKEH